MLNTVASQRLVFEEKNFLVKIVIQKLMCQIWCIFKEKWLIFFIKKEALKSKRVIPSICLFQDSGWRKMFYHGAKLFHHVFFWITTLVFHHIFFLCKDSTGQPHLNFCIAQIMFHCHIVPMILLYHRWSIIAEKGSVWFWFNSGNLELLYFMNFYLHFNGFLDLYDPKHGAKKLQFSSGCNF